MASGCDSDPQRRLGASIGGDHTLAPQARVLRKLPIRRSQFWRGNPTFRNFAGLETDPRLHGRAGLNDASVVTFQPHGGEHARRVSPRVDTDAAAANKHVLLRCVAMNHNFFEGL